MHPNTPAISTPHRLWRHWISPPGCSNSAIKLVRCSLPKRNWSVGNLVCCSDQILNKIPKVCSKIRLLVVELMASVDLVTREWTIFFYKKFFGGKEKLTEKFEFFFPAKEFLTACNACMLGYGLFWVQISTIVTAKLHTSDFMLYLACTILSGLIHWPRFKKK